jgi:purine nucleosidase
MLSEAKHLGRGEPRPLPPCPFDPSPITLSPVARRILLDTDIGTDVDDALALAFTLRHPALELAAVTTVSGDTRRRAQIAAKLIALSGGPQIEVAAGCAEPPAGQARMFWAGHEGRGLLAEGEHVPISSRHGVDVIVDTLLAEQVEVVTIGPLTNLAAALKREPRIAERIPRLTLMGGLFQRPELQGADLPFSVEYNLNADPHSTVSVFSTPIPTTCVPADVTMRSYLLEEHVQRLEASPDPLLQALARLVRVWTPVLATLFAMTGASVPPGLAAIPHDPLALATLVERRFVTTETMPVAVAVAGGSLRTLVDPVAGRQMEVVTDVDAAAFVAFFLETLGA